jgi:hypothetical protein
LIGFGVVLILIVVILIVTLHKTTDPGPGPGPTPPSPPTPPDFFNPYKVENDTSLLNEDWLVSGYLSTTEEKLEDLYQNRHPLGDDKGFKLDPR